MNPDRRLRNLIACIALLAAAGSASAADDSKTSSIDFTRDIKPIFIEHCYLCHGPDKQKAELRLDGREAALKGGDSGPVIKPGDPDKSLLIKMITSSDPDQVMPPKKIKKRLTPEQIDTLTKWVRQGAKWPKSTTGSSDHWAYAPVIEVKPPDSQQFNPIDGFVRARLKTAGISPSPSADRYTLIKRLYYDLLGLPPNPRQVSAFVNDRSPKAYEDLVKQLLASPHFGERWGRHWLDKARYADSDGYEKDRPRKNAWRYRDWVIQAINNDMPFDQFTIEQLAGDLLPNAGPMQKLATAFHRQTLTNTEGGTDKEQFRTEAVFDRVETTGTVWLGLTMLCARCHTHKYDAITQTEYYQLYAFFNNGDETNTTVPTSADAAARYQQDKARHDQQVSQFRKKVDAYREQVSARIPAWEKQIQQKLKRTAANAIQFHDLKIIKAQGPAGVKLTVAKDGTILVSGNSVDKAKYTITVESTVKNITGIRVDVLTDKTLPAKGPGRAPNGNFVLSHLRLYANDTAKLETKHAVKLISARADFAQNKFAARSALDRNARNGWAVSPQMGRNHWAWFAAAKPISFKDKTFLQIVLDQQYGGKHTIGKFKLRAMTGTVADSLVPDAVRKILSVAPTKRNDKQKTTLAEYYLGSVDAQGSKLIKQLEDLKQKAPKTASMSVRIIAQRGNPRTTKVLHRGDFLDPKDTVQPGTLAVLHPFKKRDGSAPSTMPDRLDLATWLVDAKNPLTPRVTVNHIWSKLFGRGLVGTINDFGVRGEMPTHPKLLDYLASRLIKRGWSRKKMIELIVTSATYRQSSHHRPDVAKLDPQNMLLHRQNRFRIEAEIVRDVNLAIGGLLSKKIGGPSVFPPMPRDVANLSYANNFKWAESKGEDRYRRGMYTFFKRTSPHPNLIVFDCPSSNVTNVKRTLSNTPLQALTTLNNLVFVEASQGLAKRVLTQPGLNDDDDRVKFAFTVCASRPPNSNEQARFIDLLQQSRAYYKTNPQDAKKLANRHAPDGVPIQDTAAWVATARIMMNMDQVLTRE